MIKLKSGIFYYIYISEKDVFISEESPQRSDKDKKWYHPDCGLRCINYVRIGEPEDSDNIQEFIDTAINIKDIKKED